MQPSVAHVVSSEYQAAAEALYRARRSLERIDSLPEGQRPKTLTDGYAIQSVLAGLIGQTSGWKLAASGPAPQRRYGLSHPLIGRLAVDRALPPGAVLPCGWFRNPVVEPELAIVVGHALPTDLIQRSDEELLDLVETVRLAIEVPDSRFVDRDAIDAPNIVADNSWDGFYILGPRVADWRQRDLRAAEVRVLRNGVEAAAGSGGAVANGPLGAFCWLARELPRIGAALAPGDAIITGTLVWPVSVAPGDAFVADFGRLGTVEVRFDA
jgi:2-keto-4-pentenoate hydratase